MAQKNWLIRTKNKQILGPATKEKVIELIEKGSLTSEDEITCGNGYWFWVREKDLLEKYLYGDLLQTFNPISEAQDVLTAKTTPDGITASIADGPQQVKETPHPQSAPNEQLPANDDLAYPDEGDLAYPDMGGEDLTSQDDEGLEKTDPMILDVPPKRPSSPKAQAKSEVTQEVKRPSKAELASPEASESPIAQEEDNFLYPSAEDLEYPEIEGEDSMELLDESEAEAELDDQTDPNVTIPSDLDQDQELIETEEELLYEDEELEDVEDVEDVDDEDEDDEEPVVASDTPQSKKGRRKKRKIVEERKSNDRYLIYIAIFIILAIGVVIYYYKSVLNKPLPVIGMQEAHAQTLSSLSKKKTSFP